MLQKFFLILEEHFGFDLKTEPLNYLNDLYKTHFVLVDPIKKEYYETSEKNYIKKYISFKNNKYQFCRKLLSI